jgi:uncharacterized protein YegP (UPF0339 family)
MADNKEYFFELRNEENEIILRANETFKTVQSCRRRIQLVRIYAIYDRNYTRHNDRLARPTFRLRNLHNEVIGLGNSYKSMAARDRGIASVRFCAANSWVMEDLIV